METMNEQEELRVPIKVWREVSGYMAEVSPPHGRSWRSSHPMKGRELDAKLRKLGCHQIDVGDAFYAADPDWLKHLDS